MKKQGKKWMLVVLALLAVVTVTLPLVGCKNDTVAEQTGDGTGSGDGNQGTGDGTGSGDGNQGTGDQGSGSGNQGSGDPEQPVTYTVTFDTKGGSSIVEQTVESGQKATKPADPTLENNVFGGWYSDEDLTQEYSFDTDVTGSFTLYAKWVKRIEVIASNVSSEIEGLTGDGSYILVVTGELNDLSAITTALSSNKSAKVNLDLSKVSDLTEIGPEAFRGCDSLTSISIPEGVKSIGPSAFYGCSGLTSISIPSSVEFIGHFAFNGCSGLTSIDLSKATGLTTIEAGAFQGCSGLTSISIPEGVEFIVGDAFRGCSGLTSISIPSSVTSIGGDAFFGCYSLTSIDLSKATGLTTIGNYAFEGCRGLTSISIPSSVTSIGNYAFEGCRDLTSISIPSSVTSIGGDAFKDCSGLTSISIPEGVTTIGAGAFQGCRGLTTVTMKATTPPELGSSAFSNTSTGLQILVPNVDNYTNEDAKEKGWEPYKDKIIEQTS